MAIRFHLPDKYCSGVSLSRSSTNTTIRYDVDRTRTKPGTVLIENPEHVAILKRDLNQPDAHGESDRVHFGAATAQTVACPACGFERWAWVRSCPRCR